MQNFFKKIKRQVLARQWRVLMHFASVDTLAGNKDSAEQKLLKGIQIAEQLVKNAPVEDRKNEELSLAYSLGELAGLLRMTGRTDQADSLAQRSSELKTKYAASGARAEIDALISRTVRAKSEKKLDEALLLATEACDLAEKTYGADAQDMVRPLMFKSGFYMNLEKFDQCEAIDRRIVAIQEKHCASNDPYLAGAYYSLGLILSLQNKLDEGNELYRKAISTLENPGVPMGEIISGMTQAKGNAAALGIMQGRMAGMDNPTGVLALGGLGRNLQKQGHLDEAEKNFKRAIKISEGRKQPDNQELYLLLKPYARFLRAAGRDIDAQAIEKRIATLKNSGSTGK